MKRNIITYFLLLLALASDAQLLTLAECRSMAIEHNESMKTADNAVKQAELDRQIAFRQYLPKIDGSVTGLFMKDRDVMGMTLQMRGTYMAGINITQPIYAGGQITAGNRLASIGKDVSEEQLRKTRMQLVADVDKAYYQLIAVRSKVRMLEAYEKQMNGLYDQVNQSVNVQMATGNDLLRISTRQNEIKYQLQKARNGELLCQLSLANVIGASFDSPVLPSDTVIIVSMPQQMSEDLSNRPDLHLLEKQIQAKEQQVKMTRANCLPTVGLSLGYSYFDNIKVKGMAQGSDGNYYPMKETYNGGNPMAMLSVSIPVFHWGAEIKKVKKAKIDVENARLQMQQSERGMRIEVRQSVQNLSDGYRMVSIAVEGKKQAEENLRVMKQKYDVKMATMTDLLDAQSQWQQACSNLIEAKAQYKIYETEHLRVTGCLE